jgi:hypothetical protein
MIRLFFILLSCICGGLDAKPKTFSRERLKEFYSTYVCEEKQTLAPAHLTGGCASFWVSTMGNDAWPGTKDRPFLTLQRARDAVRALPSSAFEDQDVYVYIEEGTYPLSEPLVLSGVDSGRKGHDVVYSAAPGKDPTISGAIPVTNWALYDAGLGIYRAKVSGYQSRQLYVNGNRRSRAQTTPYPPGFLPKWTDGGIDYIITGLNPPAWQDPTTWQNPQEIEAVIVTQWKMMRVPLAQIMPSSPLSGLITLQNPAWCNANVYLDSTTDLPGEWSFWQVTWFENALEFLTEAGQWYLDQVGGWLYYIPMPGENITTADVQLPILETLIVGQGTLDQPIHNIRFEGLTFSYATWLGPSGNNGYVSDQSGQLLLGSCHPTNIIGHDQNVVPTPGNLPFTFASNIVFYGNIFQHLGAVGLQFGFGCQGNSVYGNLFTDISSSAIEIGGVTPTDSHPSSDAYLLRNHFISNNLITNVAVEYVDAAAIFIGFTQNTTISHNTIVNVPWSGIAIGWGWGLLDVGSFPGLPHAYSGQWGTFSTPTPNSECKILYNRIHSFLNVLWDGGAIYTTGQQGPSLAKGLLIQGNVASGKRAMGGGNTFYTDGGSRYITLVSNASYDNPIGITFYGPPPQIGDPFFIFYPPYYLQNGAPYGSDSGGCVTYGDINYVNNYWLQTPLPANIDSYNAFYHALLGFYPYNAMGFFAVCPFTLNGTSYPVNLTYSTNHQISSESDIPNNILLQAGVQNRPPSIPPELWVLPPP